MPEPLTDDERDQLVARMRAEADNRENTAGLGGRPDDGGASSLRQAIDTFLAGWEHRVPPAWQEQARIIRNENDPEWADFQRLRQKFGA